MPVDIDNSGSGMRLRVAGFASTTINWRARTTSASAAEPDAFTKDGEVVMVKLFSRAYGDARNTRESTSPPCPREQRKALREEGNKMKKHHPKGGSTCDCRATPREGACHPMQGAGGFPIEISQTIAELSKLDADFVDSGRYQASAPTRAGWPGVFRMPALAELGGRAEDAPAPTTLLHRSDGSSLPSTGPFIFGRNLGEEVTVVITVLRSLHPVERVFAEFGARQRPFLWTPFLARVVQGASFVRDGGLIVVWSPGGRTRLCSDSAFGEIPVLSDQVQNRRIRLYALDRHSTVPQFRALPTPTEPGDDAVFGHEYDGGGNIGIGCEFTSCFFGRWGSLTPIFQYDPSCIATAEESKSFEPWELFGAIRRMSCYWFQYTKELIPYRWPSGQEYNIYGNPINTEPLQIRLASFPGCFQTFPYKNYEEWYKANAPIYTKELEWKLNPTDTGFMFTGLGAGVYAVTRKTRHDPFDKENLLAVCAEDGHGHHFKLVVPLLENALVALNSDYKDNFREFVLPLDPMNQETDISMSNVVAHELGHAIGLEHVQRCSQEPYELMQCSVSAPKDTWYLGFRERDKARARVLYPHFSTHYYSENKPCDYQISFIFDSGPHCCES